MEIAHFILSMGVGGGEKLVRRLSQNVQISGYTNRVVCFDRIDGFRNEFLEKNIHLVLVQRKPMVFDYRVMGPLVRMIRKHGIKLIHAHDLSSLAYGVAAARLTNSKVIMTEHSRHYVDAAFKRQLEKWVLIMASSHLVEVSQELMRASISRDKIPRQRISVIENGVDIKAYGKAVPVSLHRELGIPLDHKICLTVGRLETIKGQHHLIRAMESLKAGRKNYHLVLAGDGTCRCDLAEQVRAAGLGRRVHFLGARNDIPGLMAGADVLIIPSESEGLPFVLLEAMAAGLTVIASRVGEIPDILGNNERGILVKPRDHLGLAAALEQFFLKNHPLHFSEKTRAYVQKKYSEQTMVNQYKTLYKSLLPKVGYTG